MQANEFTTPSSFVRYDFYQYQISRRRSLLSQTAKVRCCELFDLGDFAISALTSYFVPLPVKEVNCLLFVLSRVKTIPEFLPAVDALFPTSRERSELTRENNSGNSSCFGRML